MDECLLLVYGESSRYIFYLDQNIVVGRQALVGQVLCWIPDRRP